MMYLNDYNECLALNMVKTRATTTNHHLSTDKRDNIKYLPVIID